MDKSLYEIMKQIQDEKKSDFTKDIKFLGTITTDENDVAGKVGVTRDVFMLIDEMPDGTTVRKFYDGDKNFIGAINKDGKLYPSDEFASEDLSFLGQLENLAENDGVSLNEIDAELEEIAKALGIDKSQILSMSELELDQKVGEAEKDPSLSLDDSEEGISEEKKAANDQALENINSKQEIDLNQKIDDRHTLGEVLGVPAGSTLISVFSDTIENNTNSTRFSFIIRTPDGALKPADMLEQIGGKESDKNVYATNRDGSEVEKQRVNSSYAIKSPIVKDAILTARIGQFGYIEINYGQLDKTSNKDAFTQELETERSYYTTYKVREQFSQKNGTDNIVDKMDEIERHEEYGCHDLSIDEADGDLSTGHIHEKAIEDIKAYDNSIEDVFTDKEIEERLQKMSEEFPDESFEEVVSRTQRDLAEDASRMHGGPAGR